MKNLFRWLSSGLLFLLAASTAQAAPITVNFYTTGVFSGCAALGGGPTFATCTMGTTILRYDFAGSLAVPSSVGLTDAVPSASVQYGGFTLSGGSTLSNFSGASFTLSLIQTGPSAGSQALTGAISGTVAAQSGQLFWGPVQPGSWDIGAIHWTIALPFQQVGGVAINPPDAGGVPGPTEILLGTASMDPTTTAPEPASLLLLGVGLGGVFLRRRRA